MIRIIWIGWSKSWKNFGWDYNNQSSRTTFREEWDLSDYMGAIFFGPIDIDFWTISRLDIQ